MLIETFLVVCISAVLLYAMKTVSNLIDAYCLITFGKTTNFHQLLPNHAGDQIRLEIGYIHMVVYHWNRLLSEGYAKLFSLSHLREGEYQNGQTDGT